MDTGEGDRRASGGRVGAGTTIGVKMRGDSAIIKNAKRLRRDSTDTERALWHVLRRKQLGWRFRRQVPIPPYIVDFACLEARLVIEADGGQHAEAEVDVERDAMIRQKGWRILRFWNNDILENRSGVVERVLEILNTAPVAPRKPPP